MRFHLKVLPLKNPKKPQPSVDEWNCLSEFIGDQTRENSYNRHVSCRNFSSAIEHPANGFSPKPESFGLSFAERGVRCRRKAIAK